MCTTSTGNSKNQKVVDGIANDLSNIRTSDVIGRGNEARCCKISLNKSCIVGALMAIAMHSEYRVWNLLANIALKPADSIDGFLSIMS